MLKRLLLCGVAAGLGMGLSAAVAQPREPAAPVAPPGYAQSDQSGPQYSTPAEEAQTYMLNQQSQDGYYAPPAVLNGEQPGGLTRAQRDSQREAAAYDQSRSQYQQSQERYQHSLHNYQLQRRDWRHTQRDYRAAMTRYDRAAWNFDDYPRALDVDFGSPHVVRLGMLGQPSIIDGAPLQGPDGWEGRVIGWRTAPDGRQVVEVALNHHFAVWVAPRDVRYDRAAAVAVTRLNKNDMWGEPGVYLQQAYYTPAAAQTGAGSY